MTLSALLSLTLRLPSLSIGGKFSSSLDIFVDTEEVATRSYIIRSA